MDRIRQAKREVRLNNWQRMYEEYIASGQTVRQWCADNNITPKTYYYRLRKLREGALKQEQHEIVPVGGAEGKSYLPIKFHLNYLALQSRLFHKSFPKPASRFFVRFRVLIYYTSSY